METEVSGVVDFMQIPQERINGTNYILVTDCEDVDAEEIEVLILKDISKDEDKESVYEIVEDENEAKVVAELFEDSIGDVDIV